MQSKQMKDCLLEKGYTDQVTTKPTYIMSLPLSQQTYHAPQLNEKEKRVGTSGTNHNVGSMENNLYKVKRALQKTSYTGDIDTDQLSRGVPSAVLKIVHHLLFRASERFSNHIHEAAIRQGGAVHQDLKFMPDMQFYKSICLILVDLFAYRVDLTPKQFFQEGFAERKMILALDLYDILKNVRKNIRVNDRLAMAQEAGSSGAVHASDENVKQYTIVDHREQVQKQMMFKLNTELQKRQITVVEQFNIQHPVSEAQNQNESQQNQYVPLRQTHQMAVGIGLGGEEGDPKFAQTITPPQEFPLSHQQSQMSDVSASSAGQSVYSITRQRDRKMRKAQMRGQQESIKSSEFQMERPKASVGSPQRVTQSILKASSPTKDRRFPAVIEEDERQGDDMDTPPDSRYVNRFEAQEQQEEEDGGAEMQALQTLSMSIMSVSQKYEQMGLKITRKLEDLERNNTELKNKVDIISQHQQTQKKEQVEELA